jgi:hypothetical protein
MFVRIQYFPGRMDHPGYLKLQNNETVKSAR